MSDTLTALQTALSPKTGMQRIPFPLESYEHPSLPLVAKRLVNLMAEKQPADARTTAALVSTPGLVPYTPIGTGPIVAMNDDVPGAIYIVSGTEAFRMSFDPGGNPTFEGIGNVGTPGAGTSPWNSFVTIAAGLAVVICSAPHATCGHLPGDLLSQITDPGFPRRHHRSVTWAATFAFSALGDTAQWFISRLLGPRQASMRSASFSAMRCRGIDPPGDHPSRAGLDLRRERVRGLVRRGNVRVGDNAGHVLLSVPPRRRGRHQHRHRLANVRLPGRQLRCGGSASAASSTARMATPRSVSRRTPSRPSSAPSTVSLWAVTHPYRGHWCYCLTAIDNRTLVYDVATGVWHEHVRPAPTTAPPWQTAVAAADNKLPAPVTGGPRLRVWLYTLAMGANGASVTDHPPGHAAACSGQARSAPSAPA